MTSDSGLAVTRSADLVRAKKSHLANLVRDLGTGLATLEEFAHGRAKLPNDILRVSSKIPALNRATNAATASINLTFVKVSGNAPAQKHQHPRQIEFIILSIFASSGSIAGLVSSIGRPTPSEESAVPDELVPGAATVVPKAPPIVDI
jgi:hypothetical protein